MNKRLITMCVAMLAALIMLAGLAVVAQANPPGAPTGYDLRTTSNADKSYDLCGGTLTLDFSNSKKVLDFTSTVYIDKVIYKSDTDYVTINYNPAVKSGHIDTSLDNSDFNQIYWYCADEETTTTTEEETTTTTEKETTTTTEKETTTTTAPETTTTTQPPTTVTLVVTDEGAGPSNPWIYPLAGFGLLLILGAGIQAVRHGR